MIRSRYLPLVLLLLLVVLSVAGCDQAPKRLAIGDPAPDFTATDYRGRTVSLAAWQGKPVVIRFFYPDCKYCKADTKVFNEYYQRLHERGLEIVYVNTRPGSVPMETFARDLGIEFPIVEDTDGSLANRFQVRVVPQAIVLTPEHRIASAVMGGVSGAELEQLLGPYFP